MSNEEASDRRYLLISSDGRYTTLSRDTVPDEETIDIATEGLDSVGMAGWLVMSEGDYRGDDPLILIPIRLLTAVSDDWEAAAIEFSKRRAAALTRRA